MVLVPVDLLLVTAVFFTGFISGGLAAVWYLQRYLDSMVDDVVDLGFGDSSGEGLDGVLSDVDVSELEDEVGK